MGFELWAVDLADKNRDRNRIRQYLINTGLSDVEAEQALDDAFSKVATNNRSYGCLRILAGCGMLVLGKLALLIIVSVVCVEPNPGQHGSKLIKLGVIGGGLTIGGLIAIVLGLFSLTSGKS